MEIDTTTEFGRRVLRRLQGELIIWLTTTDTTGRPQPRPVWFWWDGDTILIYSRPDTAKLRHISHNPHVALHFDSNGQGGDIIVFHGQAHVDHDIPPADHVPGYTKKYRDRLLQMNSTPQEMAADFTIPLRIHLTHLRGF